MTREEKTKSIEELSRQFQNNHFYLADTGEMTVENTNQFRRICFNKGIKLKVVKNTVIKKALEKTGNQEVTALFDVLKGTTSIMFCDSTVEPARVIKDFRIRFPKPLLKAAYIQETIYKGDDQLQILATLKSKKELIADVIFILKSPAINVISALQSGKNKLAGILKTLSDKPEIIDNNK